MKGGSQDPFSTLFTGSITAKIGGSIMPIIDRLIKYWGDGSWEDSGTDLKSVPQDDALHEAKLLKLSCDKAHADLHWHSVLTIDECLQMTAQWYKFFYTVPLRDSMYDICTQQIAEYGERAKSRSLIWTKGMRP